MAYYGFQRKKKAEETQENSIREDGWSNVFTNQGTTKDPRTSTVFNQGYSTRSLNELEHAYQYDSLSRRIVEIVPHDMLSKGFKISGDTDGNVIKSLDRLDAIQAYNDLLCWSRLYGGGIMIIGANDGKALDQPIDTKRLKSIDWLIVFDRKRVRISSENRYRDLTSKKYGQVELYEVLPLYGGESFFVHESRVIRADGLKLPAELERNNEGWGGSVLENIWDELMNVGSTYNHVSNIVKEFVQPILKMNNLANLIAQGKENLVKRRLDIIALSKSTINMILVDEKEDYEKLSSNVSGLDKILEAFDRKLCAGSGIHLTRLFGISANGIERDGQSGLTDYYDLIAGEQLNKLTPMLKKLIDLIIVAENQSIKPGEYTIEFNPLVTLDDKQLAQLRNLQSQTDQIYMQNQVIKPIEVRTSRYGGEVYSHETIIDKAYDKEIESALPDKQEDKSNLPGDANNSSKTIGNIA